MSWFDARNETAELNDYSPLPNGVYYMTVAEAETKHDRNGNEFIGVMFEVCNGEHKGRKLFQNLYLHSEYENQERTGRAILKLLCRAADLPTLHGPKDLMKFIGMELDVKVGSYKKKDSGDVINVVNGIVRHEPEEPTKKIASEDTW